MIPEWKLRAAAIPAGLALAAVVHTSGLGAWFERTFMAMLLHEFGHAVTGWYCGYASLPGLWKTLTGARGYGAPILMAALNGGVCWLGWRFERRWMIAIGAALLGMQVVGLRLSEDRARMWITFGGDGGAMVLGALLMAAFCVDPEVGIARTHLRWGLLVIGAVGWVDPFVTWWRARRDPDVIPFGEIEGVGLSDPSRLTEDHGWTIGQLVGRYVTLGVVCLVALAGWWAWRVWQARRDDTPRDAAAAG